mgnify:CR=1 FL=1|tara:strand:+ start:1151 stop:1570 length:420 start_codon:yes stop_codon:yes gene_type:complete
MQQTLAIIKPDAVSRLHIGEILHRIEDEGFKIVALKMVSLTKSQAEGFYAVHSERAFFNSLTDFMSSGPVVVIALEGEDVINGWRRLMGETDPAKAALGTLRREYGAAIENNATHGSDAPETAAFELNYFFTTLELSAK